MHRGADCDPPQNPREPGAASPTLLPPAHSMMKPGCQYLSGRILCTCLVSKAFVAATKGQVPELYSSDIQRGLHSQVLPDYNKQRSLFKKDEGATIPPHGCTPELKTGKAGKTAHLPISP